MTEHALTTPAGTERAATALSTQPVPPTAAGAGRWSGAPHLSPRYAWRQLTSMRTALLLLVLLALAAVPGSVLPQRGLNPVKVAEYARQHPSLAPVLDKLSLFDVFAAPWFAAVYLLLFLSLLGCLGPRIRLHARALRARPPAAPRHLGRLPAADRWETDADPDVVIRTAAATLRSRHWRVASDERGASADGRQPGGGSVAAEKGYLRETGNLLFHVSLVVLLVGIAIGGLFGYHGTVLVKEGDGFSNTVSQFDNFRPGRLVGRNAALPPFEVTLADFRATYQRTGAPRSFDATVRYRSAPDAPAAPYDIRVNHPLVVHGVKTYLLGHGYAPRFTIVDGNGNRIETTVPFLPQDGAFLSTGVVKVPDAQPEQLGFRGVFTPTSVVTPRGIQSGFPAPRAPGVTLLAYAGDLGLDSGIPQSVYQLDERRLRPVASGFLVPGDTMRLPGGGSITFAGYDEWATFQVTSDPGKVIALAAAIGIILGLMLSLRVRRRRVWVRAVPVAGGSGARRTVVEAGGLARTDSDAFAEEFDDLVSEFRMRTPSASTSTEE